MVNKNGDVFLEFKYISSDPSAFNALKHPLTHSVMATRYQNKYLLVCNRHKNKWELPGGYIDPGETPRECAIRELREESCQIAANITLIGLMKFSFQPDGRKEYGALYRGEILDVKPFTPNPECKEIILWDLESDIGYIDEIDKKLIELCL